MCMHNGYTEMRKNVDHINLFSRSDYASVKVPTHTPGTVGRGVRKNSM